MKDFQIRRSFSVLIKENTDQKKLHIWTHFTQCFFGNFEFIGAYNGKAHCAKSIRIWTYSDPHFTALELNTERYGIQLSVFSPNEGKCVAEYLQIQTLFTQSQVS